MTTEKDTKVLVRLVDVKHAIYEAFEEANKSKTSLNLESFFYIIEKEINKVELIPVIEVEKRSKNSN